MRTLKFYSDTAEFYCDYVTKLDISFFSLKNKFTLENGSTAIYPIKNRKSRISFAVEVQGDYDDVKSLSTLIKIITQPTFYCDFRYPESELAQNGIVSISAYITSDISVQKVMSEKAVNGSLYVISATLEEV